MGQIAEENAHDHPRPLDDGLTAADRGVAPSERGGRRPLRTWSWDDPWARDHSRRGRRRRGISSGPTPSQSLSTRTLTRPPSLRAGTSLVAARRPETAQFHHQPKRLHCRLSIWKLSSAVIRKHADVLRRPGPPLQELGATLGTEPSGIRVRASVFEVIFATHRSLRARWVSLAER